MSILNLEHLKVYLPYLGALPFDWHLSQPEISNGVMIKQIRVAKTPMDEISFENWSQFEEWLDDFKDEHQSRKAKFQGGGHVSSPIFRGQSNAVWQLQTSLERFFNRQVSVADYVHLSFAIQPAIETLTDRRWNLPQGPQVWNTRKFSFPHECEMFRGEGYEFLCFLRHNGFPSPLLDWSGSPYLAAFFAFNGCNDAIEEVSIFALVEHAGEGKSGWVGDPSVTELGPYTRAHRRHFLQQSRYTVCLETIEDQTYFAAHEAAFRNSDQTQDLLWKIKLPSSISRDVLKRLDSHNINAYSLFGSDEALMQTLAFRQFEDFVERGLLPGED